MKSEISSLELYYLMRELKVLEGAKVDRVFHAKGAQRELLIGFHITGQGKKFLRIILPSMIFLSDYKESSDTPTGFCMMLRKYLEGSRIKGIRQKDFERIIEMEFDAKGSKFYIIAELFSKGNMIFCDDKYKILNILEQQHWKERELKKDEIYLYPKSSFNALTASKEEFSSKIINSGKESVIKAVAIALGLGGTYAEEMCAGTGIDKSGNVKNLTEKNMTMLYKNFKKLFDMEPKTNFTDGNIFPFELESFKNKEDISKIEKKYYGSFSEAIAENYSIMRNADILKGHDKGLDKMREIIADQEKLLKEYQDSYEENQDKGELIYEKYQEIKNIMETIISARKKYSWKDIKKKLDDNPDMKKFVKDIDEKTSSIIIEIEK